MNTLNQKLNTFVHTTGGRTVADSETSLSQSDPCMVLNRIEKENISG